MTMRAMVCSSESLVAVVRGTFRGFASALGKSPELRRGKTERSSVLVVRYLISVPESPWFRALRLWFLASARESENTLSDCFS